MQSDPNAHDTEKVDTKQFTTKDIFKNKVVGPFKSISGAAKKVKGAAGAAGAMQGVIGDLASPLGAIVLLLTGIGVSVAGLSGYRWFKRDKHALQTRLDNGELTIEDYNEEASRNIWALTFSFTAITSLILVVFLVLGVQKKRGFLASKIPGLAKLQNTVLGLKKDVKQLKADVRVLQKSGGLIQGPSKASDYLHNANIFKTRGERSKARKAFEKYFSYNETMVDPHRAYTALLKDMEGISGARKVYNALAVKYPGNPSVQYAKALLFDTKPQRAMLKALVRTHPTYLPALAALSNTFSYAALGSQTMTDRRNEMNYLKQFVQHGGATKYSTYFVNKQAAQTESRGLMARHKTYSKGIMGKMVKNTVSVRASVVSGGFYSLTFVIMEQVKEIWYKKAGAGAFVSTGFMPTKNPMTGQPYPNYSLTTSGLQVGENTIQVKYKNARDEVVGPVTVKFTVQSQANRQQQLFLSYQWKNPMMKRIRYRSFRGKLYLFAMWANNPKLFSEVRYSVDNANLDQVMISNGRGKKTLMLRGVSPGPHVIYFQAKMSSGWKSKVLKYNLNVSTTWAWANVAL